MIIALEEHYFDPDWNLYFDARRHSAREASPLMRRMEDLGHLRIKEMDEAGIDIQVLSHNSPGAQGLRSDAAVEWARAANDRLFAAIRNHPNRFAGFASLPTADPRAAAKELERTVTKLGFKGAMIHSLADGPILDQKRFWPIFERAAELDVPIYIHPADPHPAVMDAYYKDYMQSHPNFVRAAWGFTFEAGTQAMRLVLSGLFDQYPGLKIILGHLGEAIPFLMTRIDEALARDTSVKSFRDVFRSNFHVTTSGFFSDPALQCCIQEIGVDRILFSVDWPYASNGRATQWMEKSQLSTQDKSKILSENAQRLLQL